MAVVNPVLFVGEQGLGTTAGAPLSMDANNQLVSGNSNTEVSSVASANAGTGADTLLTGMTITPVAGTYMVWFSTDINSNTAGAAIQFSIYVGGVMKADSQRKIIPFSGGTLTSGSGRAMAATQGVVTVNGSQAIEIRWSASSGTNTAAFRTMNILRVA